jgi:hypothetical protein
MRNKTMRYVLAASLTSSAFGGMVVADDNQDRQQTQRDESRQQGPAKVMAAQVSATATVEQVDVEDRELTLRTAQGNKIKVTVPENITNLDQVKKGDKVAVEYFTSVALALKPDPSAKPRAEVTEVVERTPGPLPGGVVARRISEAVEVVKVDKNRVTVRLPTGDEDTIEVKDPEMQSAVMKLEKGDKIVITYNEAVALAIAPQDQGAKQGTQPQAPMQGQQGQQDTQGQPGQQ